MELIYKLIKEIWFPASQQEKPEGTARAGHGGSKKCVTVRKQEKQNVPSMLFKKKQIPFRNVFI